MVRGESAEPQAAAPAMEVRNGTLSLVDGDGRHEVTLPDGLRFETHGADVYLVGPDAAWPFSLELKPLPRMS